MGWLVKNTPDIFNLLLVNLNYFLSVEKICEYHIEINDIRN